MKQTGVPYFVLTELKLGESRQTVAVRILTS